MIAAIIILVVIGVVLELLQKQVPLDPAIRTLIRVIVVLAVCFYLLAMFGLVTIPAGLRLRP